MKKFLKEYYSSILIIVMILVVKLFVVDIVKVDGMSMYPTLTDKDRIVVDKYSAMTKDYNYGDIIIFHPYTDNNVLYIKRVIGLPNDKITINDGKVFVNNKELSEKYLPSDIQTYSDITSFTVPNNEVFVLGDNRNNSSDSRYFGSIPLNRIKAKMLCDINNIFR
ncbi:signal peptidase I [Clostridium kluyveri]|uniref:Signal peptidase I n=2 Tax=Clostridium kluyveri TaxID=1534 RepID=A5N973_CLOK5|nr:signal peptidase I [Clostridium kluyveri]EDK33854.1 Hypothetical protein CKL_1812 [Clostridium kluyveri DSM 555]BAH06736.1 hypothetical protein CKR_1685 [Clostridium kluyveri NBRC 12016]